MREFPIKILLSYSLVQEMSLISGKGSGLERILIGFRFGILFVVDTPDFIAVCSVPCSSS